MYKEVKLNSFDNIYGFFNFGNIFALAAVVQVHSIKTATEDLLDQLERNKQNQLTSQQQMSQLALAASDQ